MVQALLVHGAGGGAWEWAVWQRVLAAHGIAAQAMDLMPAAAGLEATRFADYLAQVRAALQPLPRPRLLVGASLGGLLGLVACAEEAVDGLVLVNPLPPAPLAARMPPRHWPARIRWAATASLAGTRRALPDADDATCLAAWRLWRDESGAVLAQAHAGIEVVPPPVPVLLLAASEDADVPPALSRALADQLDAEWVLCAGDSHVGPLLGRRAAQRAALVAAWALQRCG